MQKSKCYHRFTPSPCFETKLGQVRPCDPGGSPWGPRTQHPTAAGMHILCQKYNSLRRYAFVYIYIYISSYIYIYVYACVYVVIYVVIVLYIYIHVCIHVYIYIQLYSHMDCVWIWFHPCEHVHSEMVPTADPGPSRWYPRRTQNDQLCDWVKNWLPKKKKQIGYHWILDGFEMAKIR